MSEYHSEVLGCSKIKVPFIIHQLHNNKLKEKTKIEKKKEKKKAPTWAALEKYIGGFVREKKERT